MLPYSNVHGGQHDTKYVPFELLMHAEFLADEMWGFMLEPARSLSNVENLTVAWNTTFQIRRKSRPGQNPGFMVIGPVLHNSRP